LFFYLLPKKLHEHSNLQFHATKFKDSRIGKKWQWWVVGGGHGDGDGAPEDAFWR
jgi:hypothetical protein